MTKKILGGEIITLGPDGLWRTNDGVVIALPDGTTSSDDVVRCGVGVLSLPVESEWTDGCKAHDNAFENPAFQALNTRSEADKILRRHLLIIAGKNPLKKALAYAMYGVVRLASWAWWENDKTRWK